MTTVKTNKINCDYVSQSYFDFNFYGLVHSDLNFGLQASLVQLLNFSLNVSSADEHWYYAKLESRAVHGEKKRSAFLAAEVTR